MAAVASSSPSTVFDHPFAALRGAQFSGERPQVRGRAGFLQRSTLALSPLIMAITASAQDDTFMWFRCDACCATFFKVNKTLVEHHSKRTSIPALEFMEIMEGVCETMFTKDEFGVKQYEGQKFLFGPGIIDHIPDKGFGQMGMGDYDSRLAAYCRMFVEEVGEEELRRRFLSTRRVDRLELCKEECKDPASGTSGRVTTDRKPRKRSRQQAPSARTSVPEPRKAKRNRQASQDASPDRHSPQRSTAGPGLSNFEQMVSTIHHLSSMQLRWLGEAVLGELARRAEGAVQAGAAVSAAHRGVEL